MTPSSEPSSVRVDCRQPTFQPAPLVRRHLVEEFRDRGGIRAFHVQLREGEDRLDHEVPLPNRPGFCRGNMEVLPLQPTLLARHAK